MDEGLFSILDCEFQSVLASIYDYTRRAGPDSVLPQPLKIVTLQACPEDHLRGRCIVRTFVGSIDKQKLCDLSVVASMGALPLAENSVDVVICGGNLLNRFDVGLAISEFARVVSPRGYLAVEFDSSFSVKLLGEKTFGKSVGLSVAAGSGPYSRYAVYDRTYITNLLRALQFRRVR